MCSFEQLSDSVFARMCVILFVTDFADYGMDRMIYGMIIVEMCVLLFVTDFADYGMDRMIYGTIIVEWLYCP